MFAFGTLRTNSVRQEMFAVGAKSRHAQGCLAKRPAAFRGCSAATQFEHLDFGRLQSAGFVAAPVLRKSRLSVLISASLSSFIVCCISASGELLRCTNRVARIAEDSVGRDSVTRLARNGVVRTTIRPPNTAGPDAGKAEMFDAPKLGSLSFRHKARLGSLRDCVKSQYLRAVDTLPVRH